MILSQKQPAPHLFFHPLVYRPSEAAEMQSAEMHLLEECSSRAALCLFCLFQWDPLAPFMIAFLWFTHLSLRSPFLPCVTLL